MDSISDLNSRQDLLQRSQAIAYQWYLAILSVGGFLVDRTEALEKFSKLTDQVIAFLLSENPDPATAREIGMGLANLPCLDPIAIEISGKLWAGHMIEGAFQAEQAKFQPRFLNLINGMAAGFTEGTRAIVLDQQEDIRAAMAEDLRHTTEELKKYQSQLEEMLAERTGELRDSEEKFRVIAETSIDGIFQSSSDSPGGKLIYVNEAYAKMLGYSKEELLEKTNYSLLAEEELASLPPIVEYLKDDKPAKGEFRLKHKDGHLINVRFSVVPSMLKGNIIHSGIVNDITERKRAQEALFQSQERYRKLAEASPDMIYIIGPDDRIQYVNSFAASFLNFPAEQIVGEPRTRFFPPAISVPQESYLRQVWENGESVYGELETSTSEKSIWTGTWLVPLRDLSGNISGVMGVSRDITEQKNTEMELLRSRDQLEQRVQERTAELITSQAQLRQLSNQLVTSLEDERHRISRELHDDAGQALISLKYGLASIENDIPDSNGQARKRLVDLMGIIDQVMVHIRTLTRSLRPPVLEIVGINLSIKDYCEEFTKRTRLSINYHGEEIPGLPDEIGISLYRFIQETLTNTLKHAHATRADVNLEYEKKQITLSISDDGRGMEEAPGSDGIGLIGIEERLKLLGGSLKIDSHKGQGVTITASVPWSGPE